MSVRSLRRGSIAASRVEAPATNTLYLPGVTSSHASTPHSAANSITSDIDIRLKLAMDDWSPGGVQYLATKYGVSGTRAWLLQNNGSTGLLRLNISPNGSTTVNADSSVAPGFMDGSAHWLRVTWENAADECLFYTSEDGSSWSQLGTPRPLVAAVIAAGSAPVNVGPYGSFGSTTGLTIYYFELRNGIDGPVVNSFDATAVAPAGTRNPSTVAAGGPWTINGTTWDWVAAA